MPLAQPRARATHAHSTPFKPADAVTRLRKPPNFSHFESARRQTVTPSAIPGCADKLTECFAPHHHRRVGGDVNAGRNFKQKAVECLHVTDASGFSLDLEESLFRVDELGSEIKFVVGARGKAPLVSDLVSRTRTSPSPQ